MEKISQLKDLERRIKETFNAKSWRLEFNFELEDWNEGDYALMFDGLLYIDDLLLLEEVTGDKSIQVAAYYGTDDKLQVLLHDFNALPY